MRRSSVERRSEEMMHNEREGAPSARPSLDAVHYYYCPLFLLLSEQGPRTGACRPPVFYLACSACSQPFAEGRSRLRPVQIAQGGI